MIAVGLSHLSAVVIALGEFDEAGTMLRESLALSAATDERWGMMMTLDRLGQVMRAQGNNAEAVYLFREGLALSRSNGEHWTAVLALSHLAEALHAQGEEREAWRSFQEALTMAQQAGIMRVSLYALVDIAGILAGDGSVEQAVELLEHVVVHPAVEREVKDRATQLRNNLALSLSAEQLIFVQERAKGRSFDEVVAELLRQMAVRAAH
jgi:tetratricopeptide (TPR) repeat protein